MQQMIFNIILGKRTTTSKLILFTSLFLVLCGNITFFHRVLDTYPLSRANIGFIFSLGVGLASVLFFVISLLSSRYTIKAILMVLLILSSITAYFMDSYGTVIDSQMIQNIVETNVQEASDLLSWNLLAYLLFLGVLPALIVYRVPLGQIPLKNAMLYKVRDCSISLLLICIVLFSFNKYYTSFFKEHKSLRYYTNPSYYLYSFGNYIAEKSSYDQTPPSPMGLDAKVVEKNDANRKTELVILVIGESVRADHLAINGYTRETNPYLQQEDIITFSDMHSCGTSTAYSLPCMFSRLSKKEFSSKKGRMHENILDVLAHTGSIDILWRDNNSNSKGVALRVPYEDFSLPSKNPVCSETECRDEGMLAGLDHYIENHKGKDILIVLHQMGNHGPAYFKRYPTAFEKFLPVCKSKQLEECSREEIINAYDNALLYTDYFLSRTINFLKEYETSHNTAMIYISDHGESLGENGLYLHGMPYAVAPKSQTHIASLLWLGDSMVDEVDVTALKMGQNQRLSHDNLFDSLLGIFKVQTEVYNKDLDIFFSPSFEGHFANYHNSKESKATLEQPEKNNKQTASYALDKPHFTL